MHVIMKGYGEIKLVGSDEVVAGEITLHQEGWVAVASVPPSDAGELRWFPNGGPAAASLIVRVPCGDTAGSPGTARKPVRGRDAWIPAVTAGWGSLQGEE